MVSDVNWCVYSYMKYWLWDTTWGKLINMKLHKDIDWEFPPDESRLVRNCDIINMVSSQRYIPLFHLIYKRLKYSFIIIHMVMIQVQIPLRHLNLRERIIYNHLLVNFASPLTRILTGIAWNIQWRDDWIDMNILSMQFKYPCWHCGWTRGDWINMPIYKYTHKIL